MILVVAVAAVGNNLLDVVVGGTDDDDFPPCSCNKNAVAGAVEVTLRSNNSSNKTRTVVDER